MADHVYSVTEVVGSSSKSVDDAIRNAVKTASASLRRLEWFEVTQIRGHIGNGEVAHFQVMLKLGFRYETADMKQVRKLGRRAAPPKRG
jgi:flavin-binding protein dodecin